MVLLEFTAGAMSLRKTVAIFFMYAFIQPRKPYLHPSSVLAQEVAHSMVVQLEYMQKL
ncbi:hypothetical protein NQZ68_012921 [Dissostichus eleginoides]|nr:hypothetical protein NQZ68_012921 [Dissostichus eleginoides]